MNRAHTIEIAREKTTALVRRLILGKVSAHGSVKAAVFSLSRETGISEAWIKRANEAQPTFAPMLHFYEALCDALEKEIGRQEQKLKIEKTQLEAMKNAGGKALREARTTSSEPRSRSLEKIS